MDGGPVVPGGSGAGGSVPGGSVGGEVVWDGSAWTVPATGQRWDGSAWILPSAPPAGPTWFPAPSSSVAPSVSRGSVFVGVAWRALVSSLVGGAGVGFVFVAALVAYVAFGGEVEDSVSIGYVFAGSFFGGLLGLLLGIVAAPVLGAVCCWALVPYRGDRHTIMVPRALAMFTVAGFLAVMFAGASYDNETRLSIGAIAVCSLIGAWFCGGWLTRWYVRRMEPAAPAPA